MTLSSSPLGATVHWGPGPASLRQRWMIVHSVYGWSVVSAFSPPTVFAFYIGITATNEHNQIPYDAGLAHIAYTGWKVFLFWRSKQRRIPLYEFKPRDNGTGKLGGDMVWINENRLRYFKSFPKTSLYYTCTYKTQRSVMLWKMSVRRICAALCGTYGCCVSYCN